MPRVPFEPVQQVEAEPIRSPFIQDARAGAIRRTGEIIGRSVAGAGEAIAAAKERADAMRRLGKTREAQSTASGLLSEFQTLRGMDPMEQWGEFQQRFEGKVSDLDSDFSSERERKAWQLEVVDPIRMNLSSRAAGHINSESQAHAKELLEAYRVEGGRELVSSAAAQPVTGNVEEDAERVSDQFGFEMSAYLDEIEKLALKITRSPQAAEAMVSQSRSDAIVLLVESLARQQDDTPGRLEAAKAIFEESSEFIAAEQREVLGDMLQTADRRETALKAMATAAEKAGFDDPFWIYENPDALREMQLVVDDETDPELRATMAADLNRRERDLAGARQAQQTQSVRVLNEALTASGGDITAIKRDLPQWRRLDHRDQIWLETRAAQITARQEPVTDHVAILENYWSKPNPDGSRSATTKAERAADWPGRYRAIANDADFNAIRRDWQSVNDEIAAGKVEVDTMSGTMRQRVTDQLKADGFALTPEIQSWVNRQSIAEQEAAERGGQEVTPEKADEIADRIRSGAVQEIEFFTGPATGMLGRNASFHVRDVQAWTEHLRESGIEPPQVPRGTWIDYEQLDEVERAVAEIYIQSNQRAHGLDELPEDSSRLRTAAGEYSAAAAMTEAWRRLGMNVAETAGQQFLGDSRLMRQRARVYLESLGTPITDESMAHAIRELIPFDQDRAGQVDDTEVVRYLRKLGRLYHADLYESFRFQGIEAEEAARRIGINPESLPAEPAPSTLPPAPVPPGVR